MKHISRHPSKVTGWRARPKLARPCPRHRHSLLAVLGVLLGSAAARAYDEGPRLDERTAYTVDGGHLKLGILSAEYGVLDRLAIGIDPPAWAARAVLPIWVPNVHAEVGLIQSPQFVLSLKVGGYFADVGSDDAPGTLTAVPVSVFASVELARRWWLHGEATYLFADATGTGDLDDAEVEGAVTARAAQLGAMLELRLSRVTSLTLVGRYQVYAGTLVFKGTTEPDEFTSVRLEGTMQPRVEHPWQVIPGVAFVWTNVRLVAGVGYGNYFIPGIGIAAQDRSIVPDLSFAVVL
jgi:hypothetical protein